MPSRNINLCPHSHTTHTHIHTRFCKYFPPNLNGSRKPSVSKRGQTNQVAAEVSFIYTQEGQGD